MTVLSSFRSNATGVPLTLRDEDSGLPLAKSVEFPEIYKRIIYEQNYELSFTVLNIGPTRDETASPQGEHFRMDIFPNEQNFDLDKSRHKCHHSLKEHHKIINIPKFRCEMLSNADNIALRSLPFFSHFVLQMGN
jgi:hypothetical protein